MRRIEKLDGRYRLMGGRKMGGTGRWEVHVDGSYRKMGGTGRWEVQVDGR